MEIALKLNKDFERYLDELRVKFGEDFEIINGVHPSQLDYSEFLANFTHNDTLADTSVDPNANASHKDIRSFMTEKGKASDKLFGLNKIFLEIKQKYGLKTAKQWLEQEYSKGFYLNDSTSASYMPYCWANDLTRLAKEGLFFLPNYNNQAPKHLTTFFDDVIEFVSFLSNRQSGAVGLPNIIIWSYYFWKKDVENGYFLKDPETYLRQNFQKFIYRLNQPFLRIDQTAFTNVSVFDRLYLESLFGGLEFPDGTFAIDEIEQIMDCQKVFCEVVSEVRTENMFTFPVLTASLLYKDGAFVDQEFSRWISDHNVKWMDFNFFCSDNVGVLSNCCFDGNQELYYYNTNGDLILTTFANYVESRLIDNYNGSQLINKLDKDEYIINPLTGEKANILAVSKLPNKYGKLIEIELETGGILRVTPDQKIFDNNSKSLVKAEDILKNPENYDI